MAFRLGVKFDAKDWNPLGLHDNALIWKNIQGDALALYQFDLVPDLSAPLDQEEALLKNWPDHDNGVISRSVVAVDGLLAVRAITKHRQIPAGLMYVGSWIIPRQWFSYVIKIQCREHTLAGSREAVVGDRALADNRVSLEGNGTMSGWITNSLASFSELWMYNNISEEEALDAEFPEHPLSRLRKHMRLLEPSIRLSDFVKRAPAFTNPQAKPAWWTRFFR